MKEVFRWLFMTLIIYYDAHELAAKYQYTLNRIAEKSNKQRIKKYWMASMKINANEEKIKAQNERKTATFALRRTKWRIIQILQRRWTYNCRLSHVWRTTKTYILISEAHLIRCECKIESHLVLRMNSLSRQGINWKQISIWEWEYINRYISDVHCEAKHRRKRKRKKNHFAFKSIGNGNLCKTCVKIQFQLKQYPCQPYQNRQPTESTTHTTVSLTLHIRNSTDGKSFFFCCCFSILPIAYLLNIQI